MDLSRKPAIQEASEHRLYVPVRTKLIFAQLVAVGWAAFSCYAALPWINDLAQLVPYLVAWLVVLGIAIIPGYAFAFILVSLALDRRPDQRFILKYPPLTVLVAAYNEEANIAATLQSLLQQNYPGELEIILIDDGSRDRTVAVAQSVGANAVRILRMAKNGGKARALNAGLKVATHDLIVTVDADTYPYRQALQNIVTRFLSDPPGTVAVAGAVLVRNSRTNLLTRVQEWDYFHGIAVVKRTQSLYQGTLVAQGAFSLYTKSALSEVGGWPETVGEDIVMSWALLKRDYRIGYAEDAIVFTNVPESWRQFYHQRRRWARGLVEAFKHHPQVLTRARLNWPFFFLNLFYPYLDAVFLFCFVPGLIAALFGYFFVVGPMTLAVMPLALLNNWLMFHVQKRTFCSRGLSVRRNVFGFLFYVFFAQLLMSPPSVAGYFAEFANLRKNWGTK
jgi:biofilm PGA synthesis N-glycosyltransferase PgaC